MDASDIFHKSFDEICELCRKYSRNKEEMVKCVRDSVPRASKLVNTSGVTRMEIGNILKNFKIDILVTQTSQFNYLQTKKRKEEEDHASLPIFCPLKECPLNNVSICVVCIDKHPT